MSLAYNEKTGETVIYVERKYITREEAQKMFPMEIHKDSIELETIFPNFFSEN